MIHDLTFRIDAPSAQKATALRDRLASLLSDDPDAQLINASSAQALTQYTVKGVDTKTGATFSEEVEAEDADAAEQQVKSTTRIVVSVA